MSAYEDTARVKAEAEAREDTQLYTDAVEYFDTHDLGDDLANRPEVHFEINPSIRRRHYAVETGPAEKAGDYE